MDPARIPVIVGVGEVKDRPADPADGLEPMALMAEALRRAEQEAKRQAELAAKLRQQEEARKAAEERAKAEKAEAERKAAEAARIQEQEEARRKAETDRLAAEEAQRKAERHGGAVVEEPPAPGRTGLRPATRGDLDRLVPACAAAHEEELGSDPLLRDADSFRWRTRVQIEEGRSWIWLEDGVILEDGSSYNVQWKGAGPVFVDVVASAILKLVRDQPDLFNGYNVLNETAYYNGVFQNLYDAGYCAVPDGDEVAVSTRADRKYRENFQILTSTKKYRTGVNSHQSACQVP